MKIGCLIYFYGEKYKELGRCAVDSFKKFHPDVTLFQVDETNQHEYECTKMIGQFGQGIYKYMLAYEVMSKNKCDKLIILGGDTITCSRLDEFLDNDEDDVLVSLNYPFSQVYPYFCDEMMVAIPTQMISYEDGEEHFHFNSDVACFNNVDALRQVVLCSIGHLKACQIVYENPEVLQQMNINLRDNGVQLVTPDFCGENGGLNILSTISHNNQIQASIDPRKGLDYNFKIKCIDSPYERSSVVYNVRSKGNLSAGPGEKPWAPFLSKWKVNGEKLYDAEGKHIKLYHYCEAFGSVSDDEFKGLVNSYITDWFNSETKSFFKEHCATGDFFEKEFTF